MLKNYFKIAYRNLIRDKGYSIINILGMAIGMAGAIFILIWVQHEVSFDRFHAKADRLHEAWNRTEFEGSLRSWNSTPKPLAPALKEEFPEVVNTSRYLKDQMLLGFDDNQFEVNVSCVDTSFFSMFDFPLLQGDLKTAFKDHRSIIISKDIARKLFGDINPIGKVVSINNQEQVTVTGIMENVPSNTRFELEAVVSWSYLEYLGYSDNYWGNNSVSTFVELHPNADEANVNEKISNITRRHSDEDTDVFLHPLEKWHLYSSFENGAIAGGRIETIRMFSLIAVFIVIIACINFMNISTARSERRAKEVGIRKVSGASKAMLVGQFITESALFCLCAGLISLVIVQLALPEFNILVGQQLIIPFESPLFWFGFITFIVVAALLAGSYPAFFLSSFRPSTVLKGVFKSNNSSFLPRKVLVVLQFTFSIVLITCTLIVHQQIQFAQNRETGYNKDQLIYHSLSGETQKKFESIKRTLLQSGAVLSVTRMGSPITEGWSSSWGFDWVGKEIDDKTVFDHLSTDADLIKTAGLELLAGRDIDFRQYPSDSSAILLNESAVKAMNFADPIGQIIRKDDRNWHVVGVVKNFILRSPFQEIRPMVIGGPHLGFNTIHIRLNGRLEMNENVEKVASIFKEFDPKSPFNYKFADEEYAAKFNDEQRTAKLISLFSALTVFISCLGLLGLTAYSTAQRSKEIGIRKILGASVSEIVSLLSKDFIILVIISIGIAVPISWYFMQDWLQAFAYRIDLSPGVFMWAGFLAIVVAIITVSYQSIKAALANPVDSLKNE